MNRKKVVAMLVAFAVILSLICFPVSAEINVEITSPVNGAICDVSFGCVEFSTTVGAQAVVKLDGKEIAYLTSAGENSVSFPEALRIGEHTVSVAVFDETSSAVAESTFSIQKSISNLIVNETFTNGSNDGWVGEADKKVGTAADGSDVYIRTVTGEGKDGDANGSMGKVIAESPALRSITVNGARDAFFILKSFDALSGVLELEYDIKIMNPGRLDLETKNSSGAFGYFGGQYLFSRGGFYHGTSIPYPKGEWMHVKQVLDTNAKRESVYVNNELVSTKNNIAAHANANNITQIKFEYYVTDTSSGEQGFYLDNVVLTQTDVLSGYNTLKYQTEDASFVSADTNVISESARVIKLESISPAAVSTDISELSVLADGKELAVSSSRLDSAGAAVIELAENLPDGEIVVQMGIRFPDTQEIVKYEKRFTVNTEEIGLKSVTYMRNGGNCVSARQLKRGDVVDAAITLSNRSQQSQTAVAVAAIYCGTRLCAITVAEISADAGSESIPQTLSVTIPSDERYAESFSVECYLLNSLADRKALTKADKLSE